jgi:hypothetical protein
MSADTLTFGPLTEPVHADAAGPNDPPWRDNAYLCFWSDDEPVFGHAHVSSSPNAPLTWARISLFVDGIHLAVSEPVHPGAFASDSINFDVAGPITVRTAELSVDLSCLPRFTAQDFTAAGTLGGLVPANPLQHFEQGCEVSGTISFGDRNVSFTGRGFRDRTWGFRDESAQWAEWLTLWASFDKFDVTALKVLHTTGELSVAGYVADAGGLTRITDIRFTYDGAGQLQRADLVLENGESRTLTTEATVGGLWLPVGPDNNCGPTLHAYNDYLDLDSAGSRGRALIGYGVVRKLH